MIVTFTENAWEEYVYWQSMDKKTLKKINELIKDIKRNPFAGIGKTEALKYNLKGYWSRRIDLEHCLVYLVVENELQILACRFQYD